MASKNRDFLILAALVLLALCAEVGAANYRSFLTKGQPLDQTIFVVRSVLLAATAWWAVFMVARRAADAPIDSDASTSRSRLLKVLLFSPAFLLPIVFFVVFLTDIRLFSDWSIEDRWIEGGSAILLAAAAILMIATVSTALSGKNRKWITALIAAAFAFVLFLIAMEEVSWFQRQLQVQTPYWLQGVNRQRELNLHNVNTNFFESLYYMGAFTLLVLTPFLRDTVRRLPQIKRIADFIPGRTILFAAALMTAFSFDTWNILFTQAVYFLTLGIVAYYVWLRKDGLLPVVIFIVLIAMQAGFLVHGDQLIRMWEVREYKEFLIPLLLFVYSAEVLTSVAIRDRLEDGAPFAAEAEVTACLPADQTHPA